jgi:glycine betaine/proline transport system permease protein
MPRIPIGDWIEAAVNWLQNHLAGLFNFISTVMTFLINKVLYCLTAPDWWVVVIIFTALALSTKKIGFAVFTAMAFLLIQGMRLWPDTMATLAVALVATALAIAIGIPAGIWAARDPMVSALIRPVLDFMQTLPVFVYLIPAVFFFGVGVVPAVVATVIFAIAPAVRLTELGLRQVDPEMVEASLAFGARPMQLLRQVQLPLAVPSIMAGINQAIMMSLSMAVIAGMVGSGGLGAVVLTGISRLEIGTGFEGGLGVVFLAIYLDRLTGSFPRPRKARRPARNMQQDTILATPDHEVLPTVA